MSLALPAHIDHDNAPAALRALEAAIRADQAPHIVVDASALQQFDSTALSVLLQCRRSALAMGRTFALANPPAKLSQLAGVYGVSELLA